MKRRTQHVARSSAGVRPGGGFASALMVSMVALSILAPSVSSSASYSESKLKAAFLLNFTRFVDWPESSFEGEQAPFVICVLNDSKFATTTAEVIGDHTVNDRTIAIQERIDVVDSAGCHIFFVPEGEAGQHRALIEQTSGRSVFTISAATGFAEMGGVANFIRSGKKIRLEINRRAAESANLKVSARLLRIVNVIG
jgi:hypothetical protein